MLIISKPTKIIYLALLLFFLSFPLQVNSYSGAGGECGNDKLEMSAISGTSKELEVEIDAAINSAEYWENDHFKKFKKDLTRKHVWTSAEMVSASQAKKRSLFINSWAGCSSMTLLDIVAAAGNVENARYLLASGADPNIKSIYNYTTVFMRCASLDSSGKHATQSAPSPNRPRKEIQNKIDVYSLMLEKGGNLSVTSGRTPSGKHWISALHLCSVPEVIAFYLKNGADPNLAVENPEYHHENENSIWAWHVSEIINGYEPDAHLTILSLLAPKVKNKALSPASEWGICFACSKETKNNICKKLSALIKVRDIEIFHSLSTPTSNIYPGDRCTSLTNFPKKSYNSETPKTRN